MSQPLRADEYAGNLLIKVRNQAAPVLVPLKVQVKDGPILAIILLLLGPFVGFLIRWYNNGGRDYNELRQKISDLDAEIGKHRYLPVDQQKKLDEDLDKAKNAVISRGHRPVSGLRWTTCSPRSRRRRTKQRNS